MEAGKYFQLETPEEVGAHSSEEIQDSPTDMHGQNGDEKQNFEAVMAALDNRLIWKTLGHCLNVSDLKCCRLVSHKFNRMVMDETTFKDRVVLKVKTKKLRPEEFGKTEESWKKISLTFPLKNVLNPARSNYRWLHPLLAEVEFLSLRLHGNPPSSARIDCRLLLAQLLYSCKKLKSLALEPDFTRIGSNCVPGGTETLENLQELEILEPVDKRTPSRGDNDPRMQMHRATEDFCPKLKNLKKYRSYFPQFLTNPMPNYIDAGTVRTQNEAMFLYVVSGNIFHGNRLHLESFSFYDMSNISFTGRVEENEFTHETPALVSLEVDSSQLQGFGNVVHLISYLDHRPLLEQIDIACPYFDPRYHTVVPALIHAIGHHGGSLKKLKLSITLANLGEWKFLGESNLRELRLEDYRAKAEENQWIRQIMANLPKSKSIEKLYLRGAALERGPQKSLIEPLKKEHFDRLDPKLVTQLSIFNAGGLVDNQVADLICKNFKMLHKLNLSAAQTDDEGFTDIAGLKGLQVLTLKRCGISDVTLKRIRLLELRYLDVTGNSEMTVDEIKMTMKGCPSLETLVTSVGECNLTKDDGQKICPRLKFLVQSNDGVRADL